MREPYRENQNREVGDTERSSAILRASLEEHLTTRNDGPQPPPQIPDHMLLRRIGKGSFGEVWLARNALGTLRAVKIVYRAWFDDDRPYEREFEGILKYEPISRSHEGLMQILHVGRSEKNACFFYVMELADAEKASGSSHEDEERGEAEFKVENYRPRTLRSELERSERMPAAKAAEFGLSLARALRHLHKHCLVHRDIKPSNVIFVNGQPKLADIGLVTELGSSNSYVGTEGFIPPEGPGTPEADLYALGKLLYELSSGRDRLEFPSLPAEILGLTDAEAYLELNEVVTRACAPLAAERYQTATAFEADLNLFFAGRSLRRARNSERNVTQLKRLAAVACVLFVLTALALAVSKRAEKQAQQRADRELTLRRRVENAEQEARQQLYTALLAQARANVRSREVGHRVQTLEAVRRAASISNSVELRREVVAALALPDLKFERQIAVSRDFTFRSLDPKFERIAIGHGRGPVEIRNVSDNRLLAALPASTNLMAYVGTWSPDGRYLAIKRDYDVWGFGQDLEVWDVSEERRVLVIRDARWNAKSFHPKNPWLLTGGPDGTIFLWDLERGIELSRGKFQATPENLLYSPEGQRVAASYQMTNGWGISIHHATDGTLIHLLSLTNRPAGMEWHPAGKWLAVTDHGGDVRLIDSRSGEAVLLGRHTAEAATATFTPDGDYLLTGGWEREFICWDMRTMQRVMSVGLESYVAQFRGDGGACALLSERKAELYTFERPSALRRFEEALGPRMRHATFSPDSTKLAASGDKRIAVWELNKKTAGRIVPSGSEARLFWSSTGSELFGSSYDRQFGRWKIVPETKKTDDFQVAEAEFLRPTAFRSLCVFSNMVVWTGARGSGLSEIESSVFAEPASSFTESGLNGVSADGRFLGVYQPFGTVLYVYQLPEIRPIAKLTNEAAIGGFSFSPDGSEVAVGSRGQIEFWNTATWRRSRVARDFTGLQTTGVIYQPDGRSVWMARDLRNAALHDSSSFEPLVYLPPGTLPLAVSANGRYLAVSEDMQRLQVWDLDEVRREFVELGLTNGNF